MNDDEFLATFEACTLSNQEFHHADHVRLAFLYLRRFSPSRRCVASRRA
jgi:hypothetical protein